MKHDYKLFGNSISHPHFRKNKRDQRWLWFVLAASFLAVVALGLVGA